MKQIGLSTCAVLVLGVGAIVGCGSGGASNTRSAASTPGSGVVTGGTAPGSGGRIRIVYDEAGVKPENLEAFRILKQSGGLERVVAWMNDRINLPKDITVKVTDNVAPGVEDASFGVDGETVWEPAFFLTETLQAARKLVPEVKTAGKVPSMLSEADFTPEAVFVGGTEFIFGHEMGHMVQRVLNIPVLTFEEYQADGFAAFVTLNNPSSGYKPAVQAAALFEELSGGRAPTVGDYSSDHPIIQTRVYNFLCLAAGTDPEKLRGPLIDSGFVPEGRALFCPLQWGQLNHGWWRVLEPHLSPSGKSASAAAMKQAEENYNRRMAEFAEDLKKVQEKSAGPRR